MQEPLCTTRFGASVGALQNSGQLIQVRARRSVAPHGRCGPWVYLLARSGYVELIRVVVFLLAATRNLETEPHPENVVLVIENAFF